MYLRSKIAAFILAAVLSLQVNPSYAHTQSGKLIVLRYDSALGLTLIPTLVKMKLRYILIRNRYRVNAAFRLDIKSIS